MQHARQILAVPTGLTTSDLMLLGHKDSVASRDGSCR